MKRLLILLVLLIPSLLSAQGVTWPPPQILNADPVGSCANGITAYNITGLKIWGCVGNAWAQFNTGGGGGTVTGSGTTNFVPKWTAATALGNSALDDGSTVASTISTSEPINITNQAIEQGSLANEGVTGTTLNKLAQRTTANPSTWILATASSTSVAGVCNAGCGTAGTPKIVSLGRALCVFDAGTTANHIVTTSATPGNCADSGVAVGGSLPGTTESVGIIDTTNAGAGTYTVDFNPPDLTLPGAAGGGKLKGSGTLGYVTTWIGTNQVGTSSTSANQQLFWDNTNFGLGIGTTSINVGDQLDIEQTAATAKARIRSTNVGSLGLLEVYGIGTTLGGNAQLLAENTSASSSSAALILGANASGARQLNLLYDPNHNNGTILSFNMSNSFGGPDQPMEFNDHRVAITGGNVAIGGNSETGTPLTIVGGGVNAILTLKASDATGSGNTPLLRLMNSDATNMAVAFNVGRGDSVANQFRIATDFLAGGTHNFCIADTGLGSGTSRCLVFMDNSSHISLGNPGSGSAPSLTNQVSFMSTANVINDDWNNSGVQTTYNQLATVDNGVPSELAHVNLTAQSAAIATGTAFYTTVNAGVFRISWAAKVTTAATTSSTLGGTNGFRVTYTDNDDSVVVTTHCNAGYNSTDAALNTTQAQISGACTVNAKAATAIQYGFDYTSSGATAMQFALHAKVEAL